MTFIIARKYLTFIYSQMILIFFCKHKTISELKESIKNELSNAQTWLYANRLSLNIDKSSYIIPVFHRSQKNVQSVNLCLRINDKQLLREYCIKYLDSNLSWKKTC